MATDCPTCLAVARGGRIRVTEEGADLSVTAYHLLRGVLLRSRRAALDSDDPGLASEVNLQIRQVDVLLEELARTQIEKGWRTSHVEPERTHS
jgi:hypothetical protein